MCIKKVTWHQCPQTGEGRDLRGYSPSDTMVKLGDAWRLSRVYHTTYTIILDEALRPGMQYHAHESNVHCAHPYHGPCEGRSGLVYQLAEGHCPACLGDKGLPRRIIARQEMMDDAMRMVTGEPLKPSPEVVGYVAQLAILAKHMVARKIPNVIIGDFMADQVVTEVRAELFCRQSDSHWTRGYGVSSCRCFLEEQGFCANLGRYLRQNEAMRIVNTHEDIVIPYINMPDPDDDDDDNWELAQARERIIEWFRDRRTARLDKLAIDRFETAPREDQRYHDCLQRLDAAVIKYVNLIRSEEAPDNRAAERNLRARAVFLRKPLEWIAYDTGLADILVKEISDIVIHWYLRVSTPASQPVDNAAWSAPIEIRRAMDNMRKDMQATMEYFEAHFSPNTRAGWRRFVHSFQKTPLREEDEVATFRRARAQLTAAAETRLSLAQVAADENVITVAASRAIRPDDADDRSCPLCGDPFDDDDVRPVVVCARSHLVCRSCTIVLVVTADAAFLEPDPQKRSRCPMCRASLSKFYRATADPADELRPPPSPEAPPVEWF
ncbi:hypothetical protein CTA2_5916 [Colletotrichum tanaceti]|uniref:RING-type domain-containing protein n=1 Tax=Colletotrichum tanaceti TaxID=1306861 RepID=A0A4U6X6X8_9PEZI|nr:hypothetical protein CTA2_5916 [Colletotrichum tanaceti]TKW50864.1 hypothetical protein CTA1_2757 [Colletotrichum tanaceti]